MFAGRADWAGGGAARGGSKERGDGILGRKGSGGRSFPGGYLDNQPRDDAWRGIISHSGLLFSNRFTYNIGNTNLVNLVVRTSSYFVRQKTCIG